MTPSLKEQSKLEERPEDPTLSDAADFRSLHERAGKSGPGEAWFNGPHRTKETTLMIEDALVRLNALEARLEQRGEMIETYGRIVDDMKRGRNVI